MPTGLSHLPEDLKSEASLGYLLRLSQRGWGFRSAVERLTNMDKVLDSIHRIIIKCNSKFCSPGRPVTSQALGNCVHGGIAAILERTVQNILGMAVRSKGDSVLD